MGFNAKTGDVYKTVFQTNDENKQRNVRKYARLVNVISISEKDDGGGSLFVSEKGSDGELRFYNVQIEPESLARARQKQATKPSEFFSGALIDKKLKEEFVKIYQKNLEGAQAVLENTVFQPNSKKNKNADGQEYYNIYTTWIRVVRNFSFFNHPKTIKGIITADGDLRNNRIRTFQLIHRTCVNAENETEMEKVCVKLDKVMESFLNQEAKDRGPTIGVRFLACDIEPVKVTTNEQPEERVNVFETSYYYDWIRNSESDEQKGHPLDRESFLDINKDFHEYIEQRFPEKKGKFKVEIMVYNNYFASNQNQKLSYKPNSYSPLKALVTTPYKSSIDDDKFYIGKYHAFTGVLMFSGDKVVPQTGEKVRREFVNNVSFDSYNGNVLKFIQTSDKKKYEVPDYLQPHKVNIEQDDSDNGAHDTTTHTMEQTNLESTKSEIKTEEVETQKAKNVVNQPPLDDFDDDIPF